MSVAAARKINLETLTMVMMMLMVPWLIYHPQCSIPTRVESQEYYVISVDT